MTKLTVSEIREVVDNYLSNKFTYFDRYYQATHRYTGGPTVPKERPRVGRGSNVFTAPETRKFEKAVKDWATSLNLPKLLCPISVFITIYDEIPDGMDAKMVQFGMEFSTRGDLDNHAKAILDALNKVMYKDDKQIVTLSVIRKYSENVGFVIGIERAGMSKSELESFKKILASRDSK